MILKAGVFKNPVFTSFQGYYLPLLRFGVIFWFLEFPSLTFRLRMETPKTRFFWLNWISKNWISKNWKSIGIHWWTSINKKQLMNHQWYSLMDHEWIHWWSINEYGPLSLVSFLWALSFGPHGVRASRLVLGFFWGSFHWGSQNRVFGVSILNLKVKDGNSKNQKMGPNLNKSQI